MPSSKSEESSIFFKYKSKFRHNFIPFSSIFTLSQFNFHRTFIKIFNFYKIPYFIFKIFHKNFKNFRKVQYLPLATVKKHVYIYVYQIFIYSLKDRKNYGK